MELGIVSDTHDNRAVIEAAADLFEGRVDAVVHCGDVVAPFSVTPFDADYEFYAVRGNNDGEWSARRVWRLRLRLARSHPPACSPDRGGHGPYQPRRCRHGPR